MLKILTVTGASTKEEPAESEGQHYIGDWISVVLTSEPLKSGSINPVPGESLILFEHQSKKKKSLRISMVWSNPMHHQFLHKCDNSHLLFSSGKWVSPLSVRSQAGPLHLGLQRSLWEDVNSAPSLLQKRVTWDLLDPWSRAWSTGSVREAEVKSCRTGAETSLRTKARVLSTEDGCYPLRC